MKETIAKLAAQIAKARLEQHLTQEGLGKRAGMVQAGISRIESGRHNFSLQTLIRVAVALKKEITLV